MCVRQVRLAHAAVSRHDLADTGPARLDAAFLSEAGPPREGVARGGEGWRGLARGGERSVVPALVARGAA